MSNNSIEARLFALEAVVKALIMTHPKPQEAFNKFSQIYPEIIRSLNRKKTAIHSDIAKELMVECNAFSVCFPKT